MYSSDVGVILLLFQLLGYGVVLWWALYVSHKLGEIARYLKTLPSVPPD